MTTIERARVKLRPTTRQREMLDTLFAGPALVADVLRSEPNSVRTPEDASFLLFRHRALLESYLSSQSRGEAVDLLKLLVLEWSTDPPEEFELSFPEDCSLSSAQQVYLPLPSLGLLEVADADRLRQLRAGNRYTPSTVTR